MTNSTVENLMDNNAGNDTNGSNYDNSDNVKPFQKKPLEPEQDESELPPVESFYEENDKLKKKGLIKKSIAITLLLSLGCSAFYVGKHVYDKPIDVMSLFNWNAESKLEKEKLLLANVNASISASKTETKTYLDGLMKNEINKIHNKIDSQQSMYLEKFKVIENSFLSKIDSKINANNLLQSELVDNKISELQEWIDNENYVDKKELQVKIDALQKNIRNKYSSQVRNLEKSINSVKSTANLKSNAIGKKTPISEMSLNKNEMISTLSYQGYELYDATVWGGNPIASIVFDSNLIQRTEGSRINRGSYLTIKKIKVSGSRNGEEYIHLFDAKNNKTIKLMKAY